MSTFTVIMLAIVSYFVIGGFIMGLINESNFIMNRVYFWPVHVMAWLIEIGGNLGEAVREMIDKRLYN